LKYIHQKTQKTSKGLVPSGGLKLALSEKPLSLEFTPLEVYIYGNAFTETNNIIKPNVKKKTT
jgi:hypothetical protein